MFIAGWHGDLPALISRVLKRFAVLFMIVAAPRDYAAVIAEFSLQFPAYLAREEFLQNCILRPHWFQSMSN